MSGPRRLDPHDLAPADLLDHLHPTTTGDAAMPATTDVLTTYRECPADQAEAVSLTALRRIWRDLSTIDARVEQADDMHVPLTAPGVRAVSTLLADVEALYRDTDRHHQGVVCGWSGDVELVRDAGAEYRWTCPRCGTEHDETVERGQE